MPPAKLTVRQDEADGGALLTLTLTENLMQALRLCGGGNAPSESKRALATTDKARSTSRLVEDLLPFACTRLRVHLFMPTSAATYAAPQK